MEHKLLPIRAIADQLNLPDEYLDYYGQHMAIMAGMAVFFLAEQTAADRTKKPR